MLFYGNISSNNAMIFLHGYNQTAKDAKKKLMETMHKETLDKYSIVIFFPNRKWFSYENETSFKYVNHELFSSRKFLHKQIEDMEKKFDKVLLSGYSQGACTAIDAAFTYKHNIPILSISGFPLRKYVQNNTLYATHGGRDTCITLKRATKYYKNYENMMLLLSESDHWGFWHIKSFQLFFQYFIEKHIV